MTTTSCKTCRPILMNDRNAKALRDRQKTQTRRPMKKQPLFYGDRGVRSPSVPDAWNLSSSTEPRASLRNLPLPCPFGRPGDTLWVREAFAIESNFNMGDVYNEPDRPLGPVVWHEDEFFGRYFECPRYRASEPHTLLLESDDDGDPVMKWKPSIHMPRWACRTILHITDIRAETVQSISEEDAIAEGCRGHGWQRHPSLGICTDDGQLPGEELEQNWRSIYDGDYSWDANPWVWVVEFEVEEASNQ